MPVTHGMSGTPIYKLWWGMVSRCTYPKTRGYSRYGGRGVTACERWLKFENFYADMGDRPSGMTLDRKDNDRGYEPANARWASNAAQQRNRSNNVRVEWGDRQWILADLCRHLGVRSTHIYRNVRRGMTLREAVLHLAHLKERHDAKVK